MKLKSVAAIIGLQACFFLLILNPFLFCQAATVPDRVIAFVDVHLVPMDAERVVEGQTIIVRDGKIVTIGPVESTPLPPDALRVDGTGKYLMPGLIEERARQFTGEKLY